MLVHIFLVRMTNLRETQCVLDLLVKNGWATRALLIEPAPDQIAMRVDWTQAGKERMRALAILIRDLERESGRLQSGECDVLRSLVSQFCYSDSAVEWPPALSALPPMSTPGP